MSTLKANDFLGFRMKSSLLLNETSSFIVKNAFYTVFQSNPVYLPLKRFLFAAPHNDSLGFAVQHSRVSISADRIWT
jgi:hypothetical protein